MTHTGLLHYAAALLTAALCICTIDQLPAEEPSDEFVQTIVELLKDQDKDIRALALDQVRSEAPGEAATRIFAAQLPQLPADVQAALISALADRADAEAREPVLELLQSTEDGAVKAAALKSLGTLGQPEDVKILVKSLGDGSATIQDAARESLLRLPGDAAVKAVASELQDAEPAQQVALINVLKQRDGVEAVPQLLEAARAEDAKLRTAAMSALAQLAGPESIAAMVPAVLKAERGAERDAAERAIAAVSSRIENEEQRARPLIDAMNELPEEQQTVLLSAVGRIGGAAALDVIQAALADSDFNKHEIGLRALCNWPNASIAPQLKHLATADEHPAHQRLALRTLIRVAPLEDGRSDAERLSLLKEVFEMASREEDKRLALQRASAIRSVDTLRFVAPFMDDEKFAQTACEAVVELAHDRRLREPNKAEFHAALDRVIATSDDPVVVDRAERYKKGQTWQRPPAK